MLQNSSWTRPQDWNGLNAERKRLWQEMADVLEQFYRDMRTHLHINTGLSSYITPEEEISFKNFLKIIEDQDKVYQAANMVYSISIKPGGSKKLVDLSQGLLNEKDLPYLYFSTFAFMLIQIFESSLNVLRKTLSTMKLTNKKGEPWPRSIEDTSPRTLLDLLHKDSPESVEHIQETLFKYKPIRDAFSHGLWWYENERIYYVENANSPDIHFISVEDFFSILPEQSMFGQCILWVSGMLIREGFFNP